MAESALNLRFVLALGGAVTCTLLAVVALLVSGPAVAVLLIVLAAAAVIDLVVVQQRRRARARAHVGADHRHDSLFE